MTSMLETYGFQVFLTQKADKVTLRQDLLIMAAYEVEAPVGSTLNKWMTNSPITPYQRALLPDQPMSSIKCHHTATLNPAT